MKYRNFLRWQCSQQEQKEIMEAVRVCEDKGEVQIPVGDTRRLSVQDSG